MAATGGKNDQRDDDVHKVEDEGKPRNLSLESDRGQQTTYEEITIHRRGGK